MIVVHDPACTEYGTMGHPERPARVQDTAYLLRKQKDIPIRWEKPAEAELHQILRVHKKEFVEQIQEERDFDQDTPSYEGIYTHAMRSVGAGLRALDLSLKGEAVFSLMRPPGHHAEQNRAMGFCYLNTAAICALEAVERGLSNVAVFDFDVHHGNGTEDILVKNPHCAYYSVHQYPAYPGTGKNNKGQSINYPILPGSASTNYMEACRHALFQLNSWSPDLVIVSAGFDAYEHDPLCNQNLTLEDFEALGSIIGKLPCPTFSLLEGGYSEDLPRCILAYLRGWERSRT